MNLNANELSKLLESHRACQPAIIWAQGKDLKTVWDTCERGDWLLWLVGKMADTEGWPTRKEVVRTACICAETVLHYVPTDDARSRKAIETAQLWCEDKATIAEVIASADDAYEYATYGCSSYVAPAAYASAYASLSANRDLAAYSAAAVYSTAIVDDTVLDTVGLRKMADIVRKAITLHVVPTL